MWAAKVKRPDQTHYLNSPAHHNLTCLRTVVVNLDRTVALPPANTSQRLQMSESFNNNEY